MAVSTIKYDGWKDSGLEKTGTESINISGLNYSELLVSVNISNSGNMQVFYIPKFLLSTSTRWFREGGDDAPGTGVLVTIAVATSGVTLVNAQIGNTDSTSGSKTHIYYR